VRKILQSAKGQKSGGIFSHFKDAPHPPGFGITRKRVSAERHTEPGVILQNFLQTVKNK
jgi:hypothetical protein